MHVELIVMERYPFHPHTFGRMLPWVDSEQSVALFEEMRAAGIIDEQGFSTAPPYANQTEWYCAQLIPFAALDGRWTAMPVPVDEGLLMFRTFTDTAVC